MTKRRFTAITLSLVAVATVSSSLPGHRTGGSAWMLSAEAASSSRKVSKVSATGLDATTLEMANRGQWAEVIERLQGENASATAPNKNHAWAAFGMMFLDRYDDLKAFSQKTQSLAGEKQTYDSNLVELFNLIAQKKFDEAKKLAGELAPDGKSDDVLTNLALAAISAKTGDSAKAIDYCNKIVAIAPDFAWGYRTLGFIQERSLKNVAAAEEAYLKALSVQPDAREVRDLLVDLRFTRNDFDGAIDIAEDAIKLNPKNAANYYRLSQIYTQQWRLREANQQLDKAIKLAPDTARYHRSKASVLRFQHQLEAAIAEQQLAVNLSTDKAFEMTELAALNELAGNDSAAADNLRDALKLTPAKQTTGAAHQKLVQLLLKGKRYDDLQAEFRRAILVQPDNAGLRVGLADALLKLGKTEDALKELKEASNMNNTDPRPHRMLGALYIQRKEYPAAARAYTRALNINPGSVEDLVALGYTYAQNEDYLQAETAFVTALALQQLTNAQGNRTDVMRSLATLLLTEGRYTESTVNYEEIVRQAKNPTTLKQDIFFLAESKALRDRSLSAAKHLVTAFDDLPADEQTVQRAALIDTLLRLGKTDLADAQLDKVPEAARDRLWFILESRSQRLKGDLSKALEYSNKAVAPSETNKDDIAEAYIELAQVQLAKGDYNASDAAIRKATDADSKSFTAYEVLGRIYLKRGDKEHAIEAAKRATEINPYHSSAYIVMGDALLLSNKNEQAINNYKRAVELYPALLEAHRSLRDAYSKLGQKDEALRESQLITQLEKDN